MNWADIAWLLVCCLLAGGLAGALWEVHALKAQAWKRWMVEVELKRQLALEKAGRAHDAETYARRVARWRAYAAELQAFAVREGLLAAWRAEADQLAMPWVDSTYSDPA